MSNEKNELLNADESLNEDISLRPSFLNEFIGQKNTLENLKIFIESAKRRKKTLDHVLLYGPPGLGKTTLAQIIAKEMGKNFRATSGPMVTKSGDLASILTNLDEGDVLFIDEIHRLNSQIEEILYSAMEDFVLDLIIGEGPGARSVRIDIPKFTLIGATTRLGLLTNPLRDRFGIPLRLEFYDPAELSIVVDRAASKLDFGIDKDGSMEIAKRSRGTPRIALRLLKRVIDFAVMNNKKVIDSSTASIALNRLEVDKFGLDSSDRKYLFFIANNYQGGPVGIETVAAGLSEHRDALEDTIEPFLLQQGLINRTARGRILTQKSFDHLNITPTGQAIDKFMQLDFDDG